MLLSCFVCNEHVAPLDQVLGRTPIFPGNRSRKRTLGSKPTLAAGSIRRHRFSDPTPPSLPVVLRKLQPDPGLTLNFCRQQLTNRRPSQVKSLMARAEELQRKLEEAGESNRIITQAVRLKQDELDQLSVINSAINRQLKVRRKDRGRRGGGWEEEEAGCGEGAGGDDAVSLAWREDVWHLAAHVPVLKDDECSKLPLCVRNEENPHEGKTPLRQQGPLVQPTYGSPPRALSDRLVFF